jgi:hypothetical protein
VRLPTELPPGTTRVELDDASLDALIDGIALDDKPTRGVH